MVEGVKYDQEKPRWDLLPLREVEEVVRVLTLGAKKYADDNWQTVPEARRRYTAAALRHITAWAQGRGADPETGESHIAHAVCCLLFARWHEAEGWPTEPSDAP